MRFKTLLVTTASLCCVLGAAAQAGTCTTGAANGGLPPKTDSDGWAMVNVCAGGGGSGGGTVTQGTTPWQDNIAQFGGVTVNIGQQVKAASLPVTLASDQGPLAVTQSGSWTTTLLAGSALVGGFSLYVGGAANSSSNPAFAQLTAGSSTIGAVTAPGGGALATAANQSVPPVGSGAIATSQAAPTTTANPLVAARTGAPGTGRVSVTLLNTGTVTVYFGASGVTSTTGFPLAAGAAQTLPTQAAIYGITASSTGAVAVVEAF